MPKELFLTLPSEKQARILEAALIEFSKEKFYDASINQIIKTADISRGSFYQYFEDKEDLFFYILGNIVENQGAAFINRMLQNRPGEVFLVYRELLIFNLSMLSDVKYKGLFKNLYLSMNYQLQEKVAQIFSEKRRKLLSKAPLGFKKELGYEERYFKELINIMEIINWDLLNMKIAKNLKDEEILEIFDLRMMILRKGI